MTSKITISWFCSECHNLFHTMEVESTFNEHACEVKCNKCEKQLTQQNAEPVEINPVTL